MGFGESDWILRALALINRLLMGSSFNKLSENGRSKVFGDALWGLDFMPSCLTFLYVHLFATMKQTALLLTMAICLTTSQETIELNNYGLKPLKRKKINLGLFKFVFSGILS